MILFRRLSIYPPQLCLQFRATWAFNRGVVVSNYSTGVSSVDDVAKLKNASRLIMNKRSFTDAEKREFGELVFQSPINKIVQRCKMLSLSTSIASMVMTPYVLSVSLEKTARDGTGYVGPILFSVFSLAFVFTPLLLDQLTKRLVFEMYYNKERGLYTAVYLNILLLKRAVTFRLEDVKGANPATALLFTHTVGKNLMLLPRVGFRDQETQTVFESMVDRMDFEEAKRRDDDDDDEPAKATTDHHKRQQDQ